MRRSLGTLVALCGLVMVLTGLALAQDKPADATLTLSEGSAGAPGLNLSLAQ